MPMLFLGLAVLIFLIWAMYGFARADPKKLVPIVRTAGGIGALAGAAFLGARGQVAFAVPLGLAGLSLLGSIPTAASFSRRTQKATGQVSRVRTAFIDMELDHDSGAMRGTILQGKHQGVPLVSAPRLREYPRGSGATTRAEPCPRLRTPAGAGAIDGVRAGRPLP